MLKYKVFSRSITGDNDIESVVNKWLNDNPKIDIIRIEEHEVISSSLYIIVHIWYKDKIEDFKNK